ncbi:MAG: type II toxin-antitoxin system RelE/ParE family toxin [Planctomycetota bacterium]
MKRLERFSTEFPSDVTDALSHYDAIATDLGNRFREALQSKLRDIREHPGSFGFTDPPTRGAMLSKFPYVVIFRVTDD